MQKSITTRLSCFLLFSIAIITPFFGQSLVHGKRLAADSVRMDLAYLEQALTEIHPGIYRYQSSEDMRSHFEQLRGTIPNQISEAALMKRLAQTLQQIRCGHTYINPWNMPKALRKRLFGGSTFIPLGFRILADQMIVTHNASEQKDIKAGAKIFSINDIPVAKILDSLKTIARTDGHNFAPVANYLSVQDFRERGWEAFDLYFPLFFPMQQAQFEVEYQNYGEQAVQKATMAGLTKKARQDILSQRYGAEVLDNTQWALTFPSPDLAIMRLGSFATWDWEGFNSKKWFQDAFQKIKAQKVAHLVIDIRGNGGGLTEPADQLMGYLINEKYTPTDQGPVLIKAISIAPKLLPHLRSWNKYVRKGKFPSLFYKPYQNDCYQLKWQKSNRTIKPQKDVFTGQVYFLGGPSNVSATFTLLQRAKTLGFKQIGGTTGGNLQGINGGQYAFFHLPYSGIEVDIPLLYYSPAQPQADAGVVPDFPVNFSQRDISKAQDPFIKKVQSIIKGQ